jgi:hypothetical protein
VDESLETDYLVIGAGAAGMAFTDALLSNSNATVTIVDRRHAPGGHWLDAYPFVRLHQPSALYGVNSVPLGQDRRDVAGPNAGFYELAGADEIRAYFLQVMQQHFLPGGRVRYFPNCDYVGAGRFASRLTSRTWSARVRRKVVDTTYIEGEVPATSAPPFSVGDGVRCMPAGALTRIEEPVDRYVIIGAGKTALDACLFLLERGVSPSTIQWIKSRESWWRNRRFLQPGDLLPDLYRGVALQHEAMAQASSIEALFARCEADGTFLRIDAHVTPTMYRGAVVSEGEVAVLRTITDVVRLGHVRRIERDEITLDAGTIATTPRTVHVHCAARGLARPPLRPIFERDRVVVQPFLLGFACYQFAVLGAVEALVDNDDEKNRICPPVPYWDRCADSLRAHLAGLTHARARAAHPALAAWADATRLNPLSGLARIRDDASVVESRQRLQRYTAEAATNVARLLASEAPVTPALI